MKRFWRVFRDLDNADRSQFIRFAWGRARLPRPENWTVPFKLTRHHGGDSSLPIAHTWYGCCSGHVPRLCLVCLRPVMTLHSFFQVEVPNYSSDEIMRSRLLAAAHFGLGGFLIA